MPDTRIPSTRVPINEPKSGFVSTEWFKFLSFIFNLVGSGTSTTSIPDTLVGPPESVGNSAELDKSIQALSVESPDPVGNFAELDKSIQALSIEPPIIPQVGPVTVGWNKVLLDFPSTAANSYSDLTASVPGAVSGDMVIIGVVNSSVPAGGCFFGWVSSANTATIRFVNNTVGALDPGNNFYSIEVRRITTP